MTSSSLDFDQVNEALDRAHHELRSMVVWNRLMSMRKVEGEMEEEADESTCSSPGGDDEVGGGGRPTKLGALKMASSPFDRLPEEVLPLIVSHCSPFCAIALSSTCRAFRSVLTDEACSVVLERAWPNRATVERLLPTRTRRGVDRCDSSVVIVEWKRALIASANDFVDTSLRVLGRSMYDEVEFKLCCVAHGSSRAVKTLLTLLLDGMEHDEDDPTVRPLSSLEMFEALRRAYEEELCELDQQSFLSFVLRQEHVRFEDGALPSDAEWGLHRWLQVVRRQNDPSFLAESVARAKTMFAPKVVDKYASASGGGGVAAVVAGVGGSVEQRREETEPPYWSRRFVAPS